MNKILNRLNFLNVLITCPQIKILKKNAVVGKIQLRKGLYVNTRDLTYSGLVDMGEEVEVSGHNADHGLVFFFQSLADKFSQLIAMFGSSNPIKGYLYFIIIYLLYYLTFLIIFVVD